ncbi:hypothetical protein ACHHYP_14489 [Achlya hypogyna]|uniref:RING-type E3 ubiquitin transferase n=1 Tax=Achlya hypogyna TaxID=1202772 RepID=A0A1V9YD28_ACHHY|nr:hypothetical protein ACHHYP_14489 [Achlya hypogyna]
MSTPRMTPAAVTTNMLRASAQAFTPQASPARSERKPRKPKAQASPARPDDAAEAKPKRAPTKKAAKKPAPAAPSTPNVTPPTAPTTVEPAKKTQKTRARKSKPKPKAPVAAPTAPPTTDANDDAECCLVCAEPFTYHAIGECNHAGICSLCSMRMRILMKDTTCPICKQNMPRVIVTNVVQPYASFGIWGETGGPGVTLDEKADMFFSQCDAHYESLVALRTLRCRICPSPAKPVPAFRSLDEFAAHMHHSHKLQFCDLCLAHQHFFAHEQPLYSKAQLKAHNSQLNRQHSSQKYREYHPGCEFCQRRFYSDVELHAHLEQDHFKCHLCNAGHRYYRNYAGLESHFRKQHHLCEHPTLANRFVVFGDELEYQGHIFGLHGDDNRFLAQFTGRPREAPSEVHGDVWDFERAAHDTPPVVREAFPALPTPAAPLAPIAPPPSVAARVPPPPPAPTAPRQTIAANLLSRNQALASAFGRGPQTPDALASELAPKYSAELQEWGRTKFRTLCTIERQIEAMLADRGSFSLHLKAMPRDHRRMMHELAVFYQLQSVARDVEPRRFISLIKTPTSAVPPVTLSQFLQGPPAAKPRVRRAKVVVERDARLPVGRGWEALPPPPTPTPAADAWSDDDDDTLINPTAVTTEGATRLEFLRRADDVASDDGEA